MSSKRKNHRVYPPSDKPARNRIRQCLDQNLFVEAGAGSGKTRSLVDRIVATILAPHEQGGVPLRHIAAVTFTEKAGTELRDRLRNELERRTADVTGQTGATAEQTRQRLTEALDDLDSAAIGTLHSFARRILTEYCVEAGLPPLFEVLDEVARDVAFDRWWTHVKTAMLDDEDLAAALLLATAAGIGLDDLRPVVQAFTNNWDLLDARVLHTAPEPPATLDVSGLVTDAHRLADARHDCTDETDKFLAVLDAAADWAARLDECPDDGARLEVLAEAATTIRRGYGRKANWGGNGLDQLKKERDHLVDRAHQLHQHTIDVTLRMLAHWLARRVVDEAHARRTRGRLAFHDLLVFARDLLRTNPDVRAGLHRRYQRVLLDEFQDTDPIQIDLAARIAGGSAAAADHWTDIEIPHGRLFLVGDPKQSIYRFRRADIHVYLSAQRRIGATICLQTNFRTTSPILEWINTVFGKLIKEADGSQPAYQGLVSGRSAIPGGPPVVLLGVEEHAGLNADGLRALEADDIVTTIHAALAEHWQVQPKTATHAKGNQATPASRDCTLADIAVLVPTRTSLLQLEDALDAAGIPYRSEAGSPTYRTREIRDLLAAARAADDPSDPLALITALRSPLFGCGDDDLWTWHAHGGRWHILAPPPDTVSDGHPVRQAITYLRHLHNDRIWLSPSAVLDRIVADRRMFEVAVGHPRVDDVWRRLRFVIDQARAWSEAVHGSLRSYLTWAARQGENPTSVTDAILPEDADSIRLMTIHGAKGREFPIVILTGMSSLPRARTGATVLWPRDGGYAYKIRRGLQTANYADTHTADTWLDHDERLRRLYVACTRARDHLVVSLHRLERPNATTAEHDLTDAELLARACGEPRQEEATPSDDRQRHRHAPKANPVAPPPDYPDWQVQHRRVAAWTKHSQAVSASDLEGSQDYPTTDAAVRDPRSTQPTPEASALDTSQPNQRGANDDQGGPAIGRAVHAVLQTIDLRTGRHLETLAATCSQTEGIDEYSDTVAALVRAALDSPSVKRAATRQHWRETYVGTVIDGRVLEGFIDLVYRDDDGLVVVDYKTDTVPRSALSRRATFYRPQLAAYAISLQAATAERVARCTLVFLTTSGATEWTVDEIDEAIPRVCDEVRRRTTGRAPESSSALITADSAT